MDIARQADRTLGFIIIAVVAVVVARLYLVLRGGAMVANVEFNEHPDTGRVGCRV